MFTRRIVDTPLLVLTSFAVSEAVQILLDTICVEKTTIDEEQPIETLCPPLLGFFSKQITYKQYPIMASEVVSDRALLIAPKPGRAWLRQYDPHAYELIRQIYSGELQPVILSSKFEPKPA